MVVTVPVTGSIRSTEPFELTTHTDPLAHRISIGRAGMAMRARI
jgi:hypothetical protein